MVPIRTENRLHFSVRLDNGALEVRVERMACEGAARELRGSCAVLLGMMQGGGGERRPLVTDRRTPTSTRAGGKRGGPPASAMVYLLTYARLVRIASAPRKR